MRSEGQADIRIVGDNGAANVGDRNGLPEADGTAIVNFDARRLIPLREHAGEVVVQNMRARQDVDAVPLVAQYRERRGVGVAENVGLLKMVSSEFCSM